MEFKLNSNGDIDIDVPSEIVTSEFDGVGCVLLAQPGEYDHFLMKAAVFIFSHGEKETQGVILERPTAFSCGETAPGVIMIRYFTMYIFQLICWLLQIIT